MDRYHGHLLVQRPGTVQVFRGEMVAHRASTVEDAQRWVDIRVGVSGWCGTASHPREAHARTASCLHFIEEKI